MNYIEIERKYFLRDRIQLERLLMERGGTINLEHRQVDEYFNAPDRDFMREDPVSEWLRLRTDESRSTLNYKHWLPHGESVQTHCDEYETAVSDPSAMRLMLGTLGYTPLVTVDKRRVEIACAPVLVAMDEVEGLGSFVEFEYKGEARTVKDATAELDEFIEALGLEFGEPDRRGYPFQLLSHQASWGHLAAA